jgi:hypothetical protein
MGDGSFPGFERIYHLDEPGGHPFRATAEDVSTRDAFGLTRGERTPKKPIVLQWYMGRRIPGDFVWTSIAVLDIVSDKVVSVLRKNFCSGWSTYPVRLYDHAGNLVTGFHGLSVHGRCGPRQPERSIPVEKDQGSGPRTVYRGLFFDESAWDGSDVFAPSDGTGFVFVLERVRDLLLQAKVKGSRFERVDLYESLMKP